MFIMKKNEKKAKTAKNTCKNLPKLKLKKTPNFESRLY